MSSGNPHPSTVVVLIDSDPLSQSTVKNYLTAQGIQVAAAVDGISSGINLIRGIRPGILILELPPHPEETLETVRRIRNDYPHMGIILSAVGTSSELILRCLRAGAQEFLPRPMDIRELGEAVNRLSALTQRSGGAEPKRGRIIVVQASKGGVGATSVATNLAVTLARRSDQKTAIVDLNPHRGDVEVMLDLHPPHTLADVSVGGIIDETLLQGTMVSHKSGLYLLSGPDGADGYEKLSSMRLIEAFALLKEMFGYVVVDSLAAGDALALEVCNMADLILLVAEHDILTVRNAMTVLAHFRELDYPSGKVRLIVNRHQRKTRVGLEGIQQTVGTDVYWKIPNDFKTMSAAIDSGIPAVLQSSRSKVARSFEELATALQEIWEPNGSGERTTKR